MALSGLLGPRLSSSPSPERRIQELAQLQGYSNTSWSQVGNWNPFSWVGPLIFNLLYHYYVYLEYERESVGFDPALTTPPAFSTLGGGSGGHAAITSEVLPL